MNQGSFAVRGIWQTRIRGVLSASALFAPKTRPFAR